MTHYDVYGEMAALKVDEVNQNGRYAAQKHAEKLITPDIIQKLDIRSDDTFLDIGCGMGVSLLEIAPMVHKAVGSDHPNILERIKQEKDISKVNLVPGNFLEIDFDQKFSKILSYSVLPALPNKDVLLAFIDKALSLLTPDGRALFGDLSNIDKKKRFLESERGQVFQKEWEEQSSAAEETVNIHQEGQECIVIDDDLIMEMVKKIRENGFHAYIVDQPQGLPFGNSREDILVVGPEYKDAD